MSTKSMMIQAVESYIENYNNASADGLTELFSHNAKIEDPYDSDVVQGKDQIAEFFSTTLKSGAKLKLTQPIRIAGNRAAFCFTVCIENLTNESKATSADVQMGNIEIDVIDVFEFDESGLVVSMTAYWDSELNIRSI